MAQVKIFYEPQLELLTIFWQAPTSDQISEEVGDGVVLIKDALGSPIGMEILSFKPGDERVDSVDVHLGNERRAIAA